VNSVSSGSGVVVYLLMNR